MTYTQTSTLVHPCHICPIIWFNVKQMTYMIISYAIDMFFVEVVYDAKHNKITEVRCFKEGHLLD